MPKMTQKEIEDAEQKKRDDAAAAEKSKAEAIENDLKQQVDKDAAPAIEKQKTAVALKEGSTNLYRRKSDNLLYSLKIIEDTQPFLGRIYAANNKTFHWKGTIDQFIAEFVPTEGEVTFKPVDSTGPIPVGDEKPE